MAEQHNEIGVLKAKNWNLERKVAEMERKMAEMEKKVSPYNYMNIF